jgi:methylglutaconyl-CoA hydratase
MTADPLVIVRDEGPVRWLVLNRPDVRNALSAELVSELKTALDAAACSPARLIAIAGNGKAFSAGADLKALRAMRTASLEENEEDSQHLAELFEKIARQPQPLVAVVDGPAIAGGAGLAVACDITLASDQARLGFTEVRIGFVPAIILNFLLRSVGEKTVRELCLTGRVLEAREAAELGLVSRVVPAADASARRSRGRAPAPWPPPAR